MSPIYRWWRRSIVEPVDHEAVFARVLDESGPSARYIFMIMMSAGIAVLGLLLSSPAVVIGAMLISPLMSPILGLGFALALFDFRELRRALSALVLGTVAALLFTALIVSLSPLQAPTPEILARTSPNLFDLLVALFAALAGTFAIIRGRGETIVGVAIATALMPPLAVVGYGLATRSMPIMGGALALFVTNFVTIALAAMVTARFYGFGHHLSRRQSWAQTVILILVFVGMSIPLGISLTRIAGEAVTAGKVRTFLSGRFGDRARVTQLDIDFSHAPLSVRSVVIAPRSRAISSAQLQDDLGDVLGRPVSLQIDQVLLDPGAGAVETQRAELQSASANAARDIAAAAAVTRLVAMAAGVPEDAVTIDRDHRRVTAFAAALPGAPLEAYFTIEQRASTAAEGWVVTLVPPVTALPRIAFANNVDTLDPAAVRAVDLSIWAARHWNSPALGVPGLPADAAAVRQPTLAQRRALAIASVLREQGITAVPAPAAGQAFQLLLGVPQPRPEAAGPPA
ncbi:DUF389 domain-containing protein [Polymorphobacter fuscus]|uniref:DUF389 domain-containing protein n=2 Tax=Sandarakinorhabdus fusca TaxID=1439888 RepID=A0A7C9GVC9_9SPHN|nr:DUF389 domain-containing protein [Polymorphobacter fuscus]MQT17438.1 DUF389 domain-containing protein [Polymorphobacter fuscus]